MARRSRLEEGSEGGAGPPDGPGALKNELAQRGHCCRSLVSDDENDQAYRTGK